MGDILGWFTSDLLNRAAACFAVLIALIVLLAFADAKRLRRAGYCAAPTNRGGRCRNYIGGGARCRVRHRDGWLISDPVAVAVLAGIALLLVIVAPIPQAWSQPMLDMLN